MNGLVLLFLIAVVVGGVGISYLSGVELRLEERLGVGAVLGVMAVTLLGFLIAHTIGFGRTSSLAGVVLLGVLGGVGWWHQHAAAVTTSRSTIGHDARDFVSRLGRGWRCADSARPLAIITVISWVLTWRILANAYHDDGSGGVVAGHLSTFGDWNAHLSYAGSFMHGDNVPPTHPFVAGAPLTYHVLVNFFAAQTATFGTSVSTGLIITSALLAMAFPLVFFFTARVVTANRSVGLVAYLIFTLSGGLGFAWAIADIVRGGLGTLGALPRTYARLTEEHIWFDNPVLSYLYAQRPFQVGLPVVLIVVGMLYRRPRSEPAPVRTWWFAGVVTGLCAGFSLFGFGGALVLGAWMGRRLIDRRLPFLLPALGLGLPVVFAMRPESSHIRWQPGWMAATLEVSWLWFWLLNLGLFVPLAVWVLIRRGVLATGFDRAVAVPIWTIFVVSNLVVFHPWEWNNTHYLIIWLLVMAFPVAALIVEWMHRARWWRAVGAAAFALLVAAGSLDIWRAAEGSEGRVLLATVEGLETARWVRDHTPPRAVFLVAPEVTQPITSFGARHVVSGHIGWVWDMGVVDWSQRATDIGIALRGEPGTDEVLERYGVEYVVIGRDERGPSWRANEEYWADRGTLVYSNGEYRVYAV